MVTLTFDHHDALGWPISKVNIELYRSDQPRGIGHGSDSGTEWGPIEGEEHRQEPKQDWSARWFSVRLFGLRLLVTRVVFE